MTHTNTLETLLRQRFNQDFTRPDHLSHQQTLELQRILDHRSQRAFTSQTVDPELLQLLFACAFAAPSKSDLQQADIIHIQNPDQRERIQELIPNMPWIASAPVFLVFCGNNRRLRLLCETHQLPFPNDHLDSFMNAAVDAGIVLMNFIRAAEAVGLGCCPISVIRNQATEVSTLLKLPRWVFPLAGLCAGYPAREPPISPRLPLSVTVHTDEYDEQGWMQEVEDYDTYRQLVQPIPAHKQRHTRRYGTAEQYGWSLDKARQYSVSQRADFGAYIRAQGFNLD